LLDIRQHISEYQYNNENDFPACGVLKEDAVNGNESSPRSGALTWGSDVIAAVLERFAIPYAAVVPGSSFRGYTTAS